MNAQECAIKVIRDCRDLLKERGDAIGFVDFLLSSDFFTAPSSTKFHAAFSGGLFLHSWGVYKRLQMLLKRSPEEFKELGSDTIFLVSIFHDLCKVGMYEIQMKWQKPDGRWKEVEVWGHNDMVPLGHGEKSLYMLQNYIQVTPEEACAIRWHTNRHETGTHFFYPTGASLSEAIEKFPLTKYIHLADLYQTYAHETITSIFHDGEWIDRTGKEFDSIIDLEDLRSEIPF